MNNISILSNILGNLFYYPLTHSNNTNILPAIRESADETGFSDFVAAIDKDKTELINEDFLHLFEGCDVMHAPPWGSVYLDKDQVIFGDSTLNYRAFLSKNGMELDTGMREPEDQFGLMLMAISKIIQDTQNKEQVKELLTEHLLPWAYRYLALVEEHAQTLTYQELARIANLWCLELQEELGIVPQKLKVYR